MKNLTETVKDIWNKSLAYKPTVKELWNKSMHYKPSKLDWAIIGTTATVTTTMGFLMPETKEVIDKMGGPTVMNYGTLAYFYSIVSLYASVPMILTKELIKYSIKKIN